MDATTEPRMNLWVWLHRQTTWWEWAALSLLALYVPPLALVVIIPLTIARWRVQREWLAWSTLSLFALLITLVWVSVLAH